MANMLTVFVIYGSVLLIQNVASDCVDVDSKACGLLKRENPNVCSNKCIADICQGTCGLCPLKCYHCDSVDSPENCTKTVQCSSVSELCISTQRFTLHLQPIFSSGCVNKAVCKTLFNYSPTKRAYTLHGGCCNSDLCNQHDLDNINTTQSDEPSALTKRDEFIENLQEDPDTNINECAEHDINSVACALLHKTDPKICNKDCIGRKICPETCGTCVRCKTCKDVDSPSKCSNVSLCLQTQSCLSREQLRSDFTLGHDLSCMDDFICHAYFGGILNTRSKRQFGGGINISGQCCKSNVCNDNGIIQPTAPSG